MNLIESFALKFKKNDRESDVDVDESKHDWDSLNAKERFWLRDFAINIQKWSYFRSFWLWEVTKTDMLLLVRLVLKIV